MNMVYLGKIVNTHGLKGEIRIISNFKYKDYVFKVGNFVYINDKKYKINSYRKHKIYDMVMLDNVNIIDDALCLKGFNIYINKDDYIFPGVLNSDLIGLSVYNKNNICKGKIIDVYSSNKYDLLVIDGIKKHLVPYIDEFVDKIDLSDKKIYINYIKGLDNED